MNTDIVAIDTSRLEALLKQFNEAEEKFHTARSGVHAAFSVLIALLDGDDIRALLSPEGDEHDLAAVFRELLANAHARMRPIAEPWLTRFEHDRATLDPLRQTMESALMALGIEEERLGKMACNLMAPKREALSRSITEQTRQLNEMDRLTGLWRNGVKGSLAISLLNFTKSEQGH